VARDAPSGEEVQDDNFALVLRDNVLDVLGLDGFYIGRLSADSWPGGADRKDRRQNQ
jgi:hypothetical protein